MGVTVLGVGGGGGGAGLTRAKPTVPNVLHHFRFTPPPLPPPPTPHPPRQQAVRQSTECHLILSYKQHAT
jgi:hypothetical protein